MYAMRILARTVAMLALLALVWAGSAVAAASLESVQAPARASSGYLPGIDGAASCAGLAGSHCGNYTSILGGTPTPTCTPSWHVVSSPNMNEPQNSLQGVTAISANDIWAVGSYSNFGNVPSRTLTEHWDGTQWSVVPSPGSDPYYAYRLSAVSAVSTSDVWAVGNNTASGTLVLHWDGTQWSIVSSPTPNLYSYLLDVEAISANNVWAVGYYGEYGHPERVIIEHWDGNYWSLANAPNPSTRIDELRAVSAVAPDDVWAVGNYSDEQGNQYFSLTEHWNGTQWSVVPTPNVNGLFAVAAVSSSDVWASGSYGTPAEAIHWNGTAWSTVVLPSPPTAYFTMIDDLVAISANDVWASGNYDDCTTCPSQPLTEHWDGTQWSIISISGPAGSYLNKIAVVSANDVWTVGDQGDRSGGLFQTLTEHYTGACVGFTPSPTPTLATTGTPTNTSTRTATVTGTSVATGTILPTGTIPASATSTAPPSRSPTSTVTPCPSNWQVVFSPDVRTLRGVAAVSANDVWAVGDYGLVHWNGSDWSIVSAPYIGQLRGVSAVASNDVWAVGTNGIMHWNGTEWSFTPGPVVSTGTNAAVRALSANDVWVVGSYSDGTLSHTLVKHWNGTEWSIVPSPDGTYDNSYLTSVSATSNNDAWAVGYSNLSYNYSTLILHWDGSVWSRVPSPSPGFEQNILNGVDAISATDAWAVGFCYCRRPYDGLALHWNGATWTQITTPNLTTGSPLYAVSASSASDVWAVGTDQPSDGDSLTEHWDGGAWRLVPSPSWSGPDGLYGVDASPAEGPWAVGSVNSESSVLRYRQDCPTPVTVTPTVTSTPCSISFTDVQPTDYFYQAVIYLACHGAISGYSDGTFRPYNNTTRGQVTKIVVSGFGITIDVTGGPHFTDVPTTHPFYVYIETATHNGIVSGYSDGTFRPYNNVTRGQLAKIVTVAAMEVNGWTLLDPPSPTFSDVAPGTAFYPYVETAVSKGVISGYADHTFRPGNYATRGQIAKITYLAVVTPFSQARRQGH